MANKKESILVSTFSEGIRKKSMDKNINREIVKYIDNYVDKNSTALYYPTPYYRLFFRDEQERKFIYDTMDIEVNEVKDTLKNIPELKTGWKILNDPFSITMLLIIRENYLLATSSSSNSLKQQYQELMSKSLLFLSLSLYSSLQYKYFRFPNEDLMTYTINNLSNKYLFKQYGNVIGAIIHTAKVNHEKYTKELTSNDDITILSYLMNLRIRLNNLLQNFKSEYEKNKANGDYLAHDHESDDPENYHQNESMTTAIVEMTNKVMIKFSQSDINQQLCKIACKSCECENSVMYNTLLSVKDKENDLVRQLILDILISYFSANPKDGKSDINSKKFFAESIRLYSKSNTKDKQVLEIKEILDKFLTKYCNRYNQTERLATKTNYKKGMFTYFILFIQASFK